MFDVGAIQMILDDDLSDDPMSDTLLWVDYEKYRAVNLDEFKKAEKAGDSGDARLRILMAAKMIQNHIRLMRATYMAMRPVKLTPRRLWSKC